MRRILQVFVIFVLLLNASITYAFNGSGTEMDPYQINGSADYYQLAEDVDNGNSYKGKFFCLTKDINLSYGDQTIGSSDNRCFSGTFDGRGHTMNLALNFHGDYQAPFQYVDGATIQNLRVIGWIYAAGTQNVGGIVGYSKGETYLMSCRSSVEIKTEKSGDGSHGGLVGEVHEGTLWMYDCLFDGSFDAPGINHCGGFVGWKKGAGWVVLENCLYDPSSVNLKNDGNSTFVRYHGIIYPENDEDNPDDKVTLTSCYYRNKTDMGYKKGIDAISMDVNTLAMKLGPGWKVEGGKAVPTMRLALPFSGNGTVESPYLISSEENWNYLAAQVNGGKNYMGKYFKLTENISVSTMTGISAIRFFAGDFDGNGKTLTVNYTTAGDYCAPFRYIHDAYIHRLHVDGTINTSAKYAGGIAGHVQGANSIVQCRSSVTINASKDGDGSHGGMVGEIVKGGTYLYFVDCLFDGKFVGSETDCWGGFGGWKEDGPDVHFTNCLFNPSQLNVDSGDNETLVRNDQGSHVYINNSYYAADLGNAQGSNAKGKTAQELLSLLGSGWQLVNNTMALPNMGASIGVPLSGDGSEGNPYLIASSANWDYLTTYYNSSSDKYNNKHFKLVANMVVETMLGSESNPFNGTFDGNGMTLILSLSSTDANSSYLAPFCQLNNATVKNLSLSGSINTAGMRAASIAGFVSGTCQIENCYSDVAITSSKPQDIDAGAFVARVNQYQTLRIYGCAFTGSIEYTNQFGWEGGSFVGYTQVGSHVYLRDCIFAPSKLVGVDKGIEEETHACFVSGKVGAEELTRCYYNNVVEEASSIISPEGRQMFLVTGDSHTTVALAGTPVSYDVSKITTYKNGDTFYPGLTFDEKVYGGDGDNLSLLLTQTFKGGEVKSYKASYGTLTGTAITGTADAYTLTMTDASTIISGDILLTLKEGEDNSTAISDAEGQTLGVSLKRVLQTGGWNTFCVPFSMNIPSGWTVKQLTGSVFDSATGELTLTFEAATSIGAGKPYLVKVDAKVENPVFDNVTISSTTTTTKTEAVDFVPVMNPTNLLGGDKSVLFVMGGNKLTYPSADGSINGFRAYFQLQGAAASMARTFNMDFDDGATNITTMFSDTTAKASGIYTLDGRRIEGKPTKRGVYIINGKKTIIK